MKRKCIEFAILFKVHVIIIDRKRLQKQVTHYNKIQLAVLRCNNLKYGARSDNILAYKFQRFSTLVKHYECAAD